MGHYRAHSWDQDLSGCYLTHGWARLLPGPLAYVAGSYSSHKNTSICGWTPVVAEHRTRTRDILCDHNANCTPFLALINDIGAIGCSKPLVWIDEILSFWHHVGVILSILLLNYHTLRYLTISKERCNSHAENRFSGTQLQSFHSAQHRTRAAARGLHRIN